MKNIIRVILLTGFLLVTGCSGSGQTAADSGRHKEIKLWVAPNEVQEEFWKIAVERWNKSGLGMPVKFTTIPAAGSSEKAILTVLVSGNAPDISTNIFAGFVAQLADLGQLQELSSMAGFWKLIARRHMGHLIKGWDQDGKKYVFPIYANPTMIWWRRDILRKLGIKTVPRTFKDVYTLSEKYATSDHKYGMQVIAGKNWVDRWFDFISFYYAAAGGAPYIKDGKAVYDNSAGRSVVMFLNTMFRKGWTAPDFGGEEPLATGLVAGAVRGPWDIAYFKKMYPDILKKIVIGPMIAEHRTAGKTFTFADTKGLVIFKSSKVKKQAFAFISWVFSNDDLSLLWLKKTGLPPARGDLAENPLFKNFYATHPLDRQYADYVDVAVPPAFIESTIDVQKMMGNRMIEPIEFGTRDPLTALADAVRRTNKLLKVQQ